jgi:hypothetical protein
LFTAALFFPASWLPSCSGPATAQKPADTPITPSTETLQQLFERECIEQRNLAWVRKESHRKIEANCGNNPSSDDECRKRNDGLVSSEIPTTSGEKIVLTFFWNTEQSPALGPPDGLLSCKLEMAENLGDELGSAASLIAQRLNLGRPWKYKTDATSQIWPSADKDSRTPQLELYHRPKIPAGYGLSNWELRYAVQWRVPLSEQYLIRPSEPTSSSIP